MSGRLFGRKRTFGRRSFKSRRFHRRHAPARRRTFKRHRKHGRIATVHGMPFYRADRTMAKMRYTEHFANEVIGTAVSPYRWCIDDVYDPYTGTGGNSASGFSVLSTQYQTRLVHGMKFRITIEGIDMSDDQVAMRVVVLPQSSAASALAWSSIDQASVQPGAIVRDLQPTASGGKSRTVITGYYSTAKVEGISNLHWGSFIASGTAQPTNRPTLCLLMRATAASYTVNLHMDATYFTEWWNPLPAPLQLFDKLVDYANETGKMEELKERAVSMHPVVPHDDESKMDAMFGELHVASPPGPTMEEEVVVPHPVPLPPPPSPVVPPASAALAVAGSRSASVGVVPSLPPPAPPRPSPSPCATRPLPSPVLRSMGRAFAHGSPATHAIGR